MRWSRDVRGANERGRGGKVPDAVRGVSDGAVGDFAAGPPYAVLLRVARDNTISGTAAAAAAAAAPRAPGHGERGGRPAPPPTPVLSLRSDGAGKQAACLVFHPVAAWRCGQREAAVEVLLPAAVGLVVVTGVCVADEIRCPPEQERACIVRGKEMAVDRRKKYVRWLSNQNAVAL